MTTTLAKDRHVDRIALISDIHGNMPALEATLTDIKSRGILYSAVT